MGFPAGYYGLAILRLVFHLAFTLYYIKTAICWALHFVGALDESEESDSSSWQELHPDMNSSVPCVSADMIRDNLPLVAFGNFAERFSESMGGDLVCTVCLSEFQGEDEVRELCNCRHIFHKICLDMWLDHRQTSCPLCRSSLIPKTILDTEPNNSWVVDQIAYIFAEDLAISS